MTLGTIVKDSNVRVGNSHGARDEKTLNDKGGNVTNIIQKQIGCADYGKNRITSLKKEKRDSRKVRAKIQVCQ